MKIGILGAGDYGTALAAVLRENKHTVKFYDPAKFPNIELKAVLNWAEVILIAVPLSVVRILLKEFPDEAFKKPTLIATKGIMNLDTWSRFGYFELISGAGFGSDIKKHRRTKLTVAARGAMSGTTLAEDLLETSYLKFDKTEDLQGVALLSGLKNIYAIESGRRGLENTSQEFKGYLATTYRECERTLLANGGFVETVRLSAGLGDLALTCGSNQSRNYQFGTLLGGRRKALERKRLTRKFLKENTVEGISAIKELDKNNISIPRENQILISVTRRLKHATKR
ncbi:hypothetical protein IIZ77_01220 [Candidatus Saccharibacteria bacterium]|nr:hypothetical protein [Candidatus Saccharibacteria bacterium]